MQAQTTHILFVDDEPRILDGLRQSLRAKRKVWSMVFAESGALALEHLKQVSFDIIVSDMRMPVMDGAEFLSRAAVVQPQAARIVLSGQMDEASTTRAATVAHRFLAKPCDHEVLEATIESTLRLESLLNSARIRSCVSGMAKLPSLPKACVALNQTLKNDRTPVEAVVRIIESDMGMASKVLQLVNSSFFGLNRTIASITQAVSYLGLNTLRHLVFAESMFQEFRGTDLPSFEREQSRLLLCARIARELLTDKAMRETAATVALLHDVGSLVLADRLADEHRDIRALAVGRGIPLYQAESECLGTTHAEIGAYLLGLWGLPHDVIEPVACHHAPWKTVESLDVGASVRIADALATSLQSGEQEASLHFAPPPPELLDRLGVTELLARLGDQLRTNLPLS